jgi:hypothetical protein
MSKKFVGVTAEEDTRVLYRKEVKLNKYDVLYERWNWEGIRGESIIFTDDYVKDLSDDEIEKEVQKSPYVKHGSPLTLKRSVSGYTFVNFNFEST